MRISDWRSDVCSSDLHRDPEHWSADARPSGSHPRSGAPRLDAGRISYAWPSKSARGRNHISVIRLSYVMTPTDEALLSMLRLLKQQDYRFVTPTPATHARVIARPASNRPRSLADILGWSLPFEPSVLDTQIRMEEHTYELQTPIRLSNAF